MCPNHSVLADEAICISYTFSTPWKEGIKTEYCRSAF